MLKLIAALKTNWQPRPLFVFSDGPVSNRDAYKVNSVRELVVAKLAWARPILFERKKHLGLATSILKAVDHILEEYKTVTVLEDDCIPGPQFLRYIDLCLDKFANRGKVFFITGYTVEMPQDVLKQYEWDIYFEPRLGSWGWATWRDRWQKCDRNTTRIGALVEQEGIKLTVPGRDFPALVKKKISGEHDTWTCATTLSMLLHGAYCAYPTISHVQNIGHDGSGRHCGSVDRYATPIAETLPKRFPPTVGTHRLTHKVFKKIYGG